MKYFEDRWGKDDEKEETISNYILDLFRLLSSEEKLKIKRLIKEEKIF
ncbi:MAG: hypothetical protein ACRCX2_31970 [Paraclostridium sp.]